MEPIYLIQLRIAQKWYTENGIKATIKPSQDGIFIKVDKHLILVDGREISYRADLYKKELIKKGKEDINKFCKENPNSQINELGDLHNYFDANCYVETLFTEDGKFMLHEANEVNTELNNFIKNQLNK